MGPGRGNGDVPERALPRRRQASRRGIRTLNTVVHQAHRWQRLRCRSPTIERDEDLAVSWSSDKVPAETDIVMVDLTSGATQLLCKFSATDGAALVTAAALPILEPGPGIYDVHSKTYASNEDVGAGWGIVALQIQRQCSRVRGAVWRTEPPRFAKRHRRPHPSG
jgi:hypothetical protein